MRNFITYNDLHGSSEATYRVLAVLGVPIGAHHVKRTNQHIKSHINQ